MTERIELGIAKFVVNREKPGRNQELGFSRYRNFIIIMHKKTYNIAISRMDDIDTTGTIVKRKNLVCQNVKNRTLYENVFLTN